MIEISENVEKAARTFLPRAWTALEEERVLPVSRYRIHLRVGRDYYGSPDQSAYDNLEAVIQETYPRFANTVPLGQRAFAGPYIFSFLEACIAQLARHGNSILRFGPIIDECMAQLHRALASTSTEVACLRMTSHLETYNREPLTVGGVTLHPITGEPYTWRR